MDLRQKIISSLVAIIILVIIVDLVRRKKLMEEFSWLWLLAGISIVTIVIWENLLSLITRITGIVEPTSVVFFFGIVFLIVLNLQLSIKLSKSRDEIKNIVQRISLHEHDLESIRSELEELKKKVITPSAPYKLVLLSFWQSPEDFAGEIIVLWPGRKNVGYIQGKKGIWFCS